MRYGIQENLDTRDFRCHILEMKLLILLAAIPLLQSCELTPEERGAIVRLADDVARDKLLDKPVKPQK